MCTCMCVGMFIAHEYVCIWLCAWAHVCVHMYLYQCVSVGFISECVYASMHA